MVIKAVNHARTKGIAGPRTSHNEVVGKFQGRLNDLGSILGEKVGSFGKVYHHQIVDAVLKENFGDLLQLMGRYSGSAPDRNARKFFSLKVVNDAEDGISQSVRHNLVKDNLRSVSLDIPGGPISAESGP